MTAIEWLIGRFHFEGFIGTYCDEEQIKSKRQLMIEIIEQAKEIEKIQIIDAHFTAQREDLQFWDEAKQEALEYYNNTFKNTNK